MTTTQRVLRNASLLGASQVLTKSIVFVSYMILARLLGDLGFGEMSFGLSYGALFTVLASMGIETTVIRDIAQQRHPVQLLVSRAVTLRLLLTVIAFVIAIAGSFIFGYSSHLRIVIFLFGVAVMQDAYARLLFGVFRAQQQMQYEAVINLVNKGAVLAGLVLALALHAGIYAVGITYIAANSVLLLLAFIVLKRRFVVPTLRWDVPGWRSLLRESFPFATIVVLGTISFRIDTVMLEAMKGAVVVGWYGAPYRIIEMLGFIPDAVGSALMPAVASLYVNERWKVAGGVRQSIRFLVFIGIGLAAGGCMLSGELLGLALGPGFAPSAPAFQILVWAMVFIFVEFITITTMTAIHLQNQLILLSAVGVAVNVSLNFLLIPRYSLMGASVVTVITEALNAGLGLYFICRSLRERLVSRDLLVYVAAGGVACAVMYWLKAPAGWVAAGAAGAAVYAAAAFLLRGIRDEDVAVLKQFVKRRDGGVAK
ncbi:MAG: hypothetical protein COS95_06075 [Ignavibacteriales bacterium CG07_land_8_20_14_0_80_59_12]|nr:MAG: hypothetical protein COS95_06075 [Ignavibacteriales bacterium CG07_land_8_20_14_0_80_59_12]